MVGGEESERECKREREKKKKKATTATAATLKFGQFDSPKIQTHLNEPTTTKSYWEK